MGVSDERKKKPVVEVAETRYQPTKAEMEEEVVIDASPEEMLRVVVKDVDMRLVAPKKKRRKKAVG